MIAPQRRRPARHPVLAAVRIRLQQLVSHSRSRLSTHVLMFRSRENKASITDSKGGMLTLRETAFAVDDVPESDAVS
jgi:hypothetical protein